MRLPRPVAEVNARLREEGIVGGYDLGADYPHLAGHMLLAVTEVNTRAAIDRLVDALRKVGGVESDSERTSMKSRTIPTVYEASVPGRRGIDLPALDVPPTPLPDDMRARLRTAGALGARRGAPLPRAVAAQFRGRQRLLSARLLHHEIQSQRERGDRPHRGLRRHPSAAGPADGAGRPRRDLRAAALARRDRRLCRGDAAAGRRRARRVHRAPDDARLSPRPRRGDAQSHPHSGFGARHQSGLGHHGGLRRRRGAVRCARQCRSRGGARRLRRAPRRHHDDESQHARPVRGAGHRGGAPRPRLRRSRLWRRRQSQRDRRHRAAGRSRLRRHALQSAQDVLDPAWRRRAGLRAGRRVGAARGLLARPADRGGATAPTARATCRACRRNRSAGWRRSTAISA